MTLESLNAMSNDELRGLAEELGMEAPKGLERPFLIMEIYETEQDFPSATPDGGGSGLDLKRSGQRADDGDVQDPQSPLPSRYNENSIHAMIRDPEWAYLFWDLREDERSADRDGDQRTLSIRVLELANPQDPPQSALSWFDFPVQGDDGEWFVNLPEDGACYVFEIAAQSGQERRIIARSNPACAPRSRKAEDYARLPRRTKALMELAGLSLALERDDPPAAARRILPMGAERD
jgi:uncharacterized protein